MKRKSLIDIAKVVFSNMTLLLAGIVTSFVLPKILSIEGYGYYKVFNLYVTYIIILQFGIVEGVYLKYGGRKLDDIHKRDFTGVLKALLLIEMFVGIVISIISLCFFHAEARFIGIALAINLIVVNITNLYQYLSQALQRFTELSIRNVFKSIFMLVAVGLMFWMYRQDCEWLNYKLYVVLLIGINALLLVWYIYTYRTISIGNSEVNWKEIIILIKNGFPLCLANIISSLILALDRQVVSIAFETRDYAIYSFAYSMLTLASTVVTSVAVVMFSMFKQENEEKLVTSYRRNIELVSILACGMGVMYFPLVVFINAYLPTYYDALEIFRIIIPGLMVSSSISIVMHNYYKVLNHNFLFFKKSAVILALSLLANLIAYISFGTMSSISYASVIMIAVWYVMTDCSLKKMHNISAEYNLIYLLLMIVCFYLCTLISTLWMSFLIYFILYIIITIVFYRKRVFTLLCRRKNKHES